MKAAPLISLGVSVLLGAGAIFFGRTFLANDGKSVQAEAAPAVAMTKVLVLTATLEPGAVINPEFVKEVDWPLASVPEGALRNISDLGPKAYSRGLMVPGEPLLLPKIDTTGSVLTLASAIKPGMRAVSIVVRNDTGVSGFVLPGDRVDVNEFMDLEDANGRAEGARVSANILARPVLRHVKVLAVDQTFDPNLEGAKPSQTVTLEVTPEDALALGAASQRAALGLALISRDEEAMVQAVTEEKPVVVKPVVQPRTVRTAPVTTTVRVINGNKDEQVSAPVDRSEPKKLGAQ
ncbi:MAG TPA: Flp pilus assembly protein CpaB [Hyphomonas sp.]|nr:Flp pilus assembly protein CpaB [Hyphomonas sp.]HRJ02604.1 Flp pilus assembly protein CpaB [Hyphomonas sp.]HRK69885.1 Flp pilus assembly protein CpaB [Hyphomonas sp.]